MSRSVLATAGVALLLATAGCGGVLGGEGDSRTPYGVSPLPSPTETPPPYASVPRDLALVLADQERRLRAAGSYTLRLNQTDATGEGTLNNTYRIERVGRRGVVRTERLPGENGTAAVEVVYHGDDAFVLRRTDPGEPDRYRNLSSPIFTPTNVSVDVFGSVAADLLRSGLERNGTARFDGEEMVRYTAAGPEDAPPSAGDPVAYRATVLVADGLVRAYDWRTVRRTDEGERIVSRGHLELTGLGDTEVDRPGWAGNRTITETEKIDNATAARKGRCHDRSSQRPASASC